MDVKTDTTAASTAVTMDHRQLRKAGPKNANAESTMAKTNRIEKATRIAVNPMFTISLQISTLALQRQSAANGIRVETMS